ncbi:hypothetical protein [Nostoc phage A1]|nr:hypothetical protein [Nostoc phage A1]
MKKTARQIGIDKQRYGDRNNPEYVDLCYRTHKSCGDRCVICTKKSVEIHHAYYLGYKNDKPGVNVFAICRHCHTSQCHRYNTWLPDYDEPMKSRNTEEFITYLRQRFLFVSQAFNGIKGVMSYYGIPKNKRRNSKTKK